MTFIPAIAPDQDRTLPTSPARAIMVSLRATESGAAFPSGWLPPARSVALSKHLIPSRGFFMPRVYVTLSPAERLERRINRNGPVPSHRPELGPCWLWTGSDNGHGYGLMRHATGNYYVHRLSYELAKGTISDGLEIDHLCRTTRCVNPDHLEPVTTAVNHYRARRVQRVQRVCKVCKMEFTDLVKERQRSYCSLRCAWTSRRREPRSCTIDGCGRQSFSRGVCESHRSRWRQYGDFFPSIPIGTPGRVIAAIVKRKA